MGTVRSDAFMTDWMADSADGSGGMGLEPKLGRLLELVLMCRLESDVKL